MSGLPYHPYFKGNPPSVFTHTNNTKKPNYYFSMLYHFPRCTLGIIMYDERIYKKHFCVGLATGFLSWHKLYLSASVFESKCIIPVFLTHSFYLSLSFSLSLSSLQLPISPTKIFHLNLASMVMYRVSFTVSLKVIIEHNFSSFHL